MKRYGTLFAVGLVVAAIAVPLLFAHRERLDGRHLRVVRERVLYRSAQLPPSGIARAVKDLGVKTVVSLRDSDRPADHAEELYCGSQGIRFVRIEPLSWDGVQGTAPVDQGLARFLEVMSEPKNHPVLVHCYRGVHRTGAYVAVYRMECEGWSRERALKEMVTAGYDLLDKHDDLRGYMTRYVAGDKYRLPKNAGERVNELFEARK
jgi:tyrosine-protein phosphatase SIW14